MLTKIDDLVPWALGSLIYSIAINKHDCGHDHGCYIKKAYLLLLFGVNWTFIPKYLRTILTHYFNSPLKDPQHKCSKRGEGEGGQKSFEQC